MNTTTTTKLTITMSERAPVSILKEEWPRIAFARWHDGAVECQANHIAYVAVRRHEDGRVIVYGAHEDGPGGVHAGWRPTYAGFLLGSKNANCKTTDEEIVRAIRRVAGAIGQEDLGAECIADLPAEEV